MHIMQFIIHIHTCLFYNWQTASKWQRFCVILSNIKLIMSRLVYTYFDGKYRGEVARWLLAQAGVNYEDKRLQWADWPKQKPSKEVFCIPICFNVDSSTVVAYCYAIVLIFIWLYYSMTFYKFQWCFIATALTVSFLQCSSNFCAINQRCYCKRVKLLSLFYG